MNTSSIDAVESCVHEIVLLWHEYEEALKEYEDEKNNEFMRAIYSLMPDGIKSGIEHKAGGLFKDSYSWILANDDFKRFLDGLDNRVLWIKGGPSKGKTMLLCGIIDELQSKQSKSRPVSYCFVQPTFEPEYREAISVLRSIIWLLCFEHSELIPGIRKHYNSREFFANNSALPILRQMMDYMLGHPCLQDAVIVIDALDEIEASDEHSQDAREHLINYVIEWSKSFPAKWIVSSRNRPWIEKRFDSAQRCDHAQIITIPLELHNESISQAVKAHVQWRITKIASTHRYTTEEKDKVMGDLLLKGDDTFLWAAPMCNRIYCTSGWRAIKFLSQIPPALDQLYQRMLREITVLENSDLRRQILAAACNASGPLTLDELRHLAPAIETVVKDDSIELQDKDFENIVKECGSFLTILPPSARSITTIFKKTLDLAHQETSDYRCQTISSHAGPASCLVALEKPQQIKVSQSRIPSCFHLDSLSAGFSSVASWPYAFSANFDHTDVELPGVEPRDVELPGVEPHDVDPRDVERRDVEPPSVKPPDVEPLNAEPYDFESPAYEPSVVEAYEKILSALLTANESDSCPRTDQNVTNTMTNAEARQT
ncbi:hypothetical protein QQX98_002549 [Neonectria punicea]|uniref:Nephrocystin 3-like N-terminal domain-containing protein n=1 Tax=Neonectria punicea TaxID=979145 RepID=A0ABR1HI37_9HYPO